ncbi:MAG: FtsX-like permease family protein [Bdellovibrionota bacterium]|nr:FtsX-like permease family protein [Bdellovibrionota bacterium]|tara:strand:- start:1743 stop:2999 length:1257 start_codon:yes stop_codon:yes gene_type:complete
MIHFITLKSIKNRKFTAGLCMASIALSVVLFLGVERLRKGARDGFTNTISKTDLIVGARSGPLNLLLYTVFHMGSPTNNIHYSTYQKLKKNPMIGWTIPISLGDNYKGYRVVGTNEDFFKYYKYRGDESIKLKEGKPFKGIFDVVLGSQVAKELGHKLGDRIIISHGLSKNALYKHNESPFKITGILEKTSTPVDRGVYVSLYGIEAIHIGWETGAPNEDKLVNPETITKDDIKIAQITSFLVGAKNRILTLRLGRYIGTYEDEPLLAIIPGMALQQLWKTMGYVEQTLFLVSLCVLVVGLLGIIISLYTSINERRREMAILRSLGAGPASILGLLVYESGLLVFLGSLLGLSSLYGCLFAIGPFLESEFSLFIPIQLPDIKELTFLFSILIVGFIVGFIPAFKAYKNSLQDGLTIKV